MYEANRNVFRTAVRFRPGPPKAVVTPRTDWYRFDHLILIATAFDGPVQVGFDGAKSMRVDNSVGDDRKSSTKINASNDDRFALAA